MRGIPGVGTYVDSVWQVGTAGFLTEEFVDLDRLEVLRGPQGTMFGRDRPAAPSASGRSAQRRVRRQVHGNGRLVGPADDARRLSICRSAISSRPNGRREQNRGGYITSLKTGEEGGDIDQTVFRGDRVWEPTEKLEFPGQLRRGERVYRAARRGRRLVGAAWYPATAGLLYDNAGLPYSQVSQMAGFPGGEVGKWENRSEITIPNNYVRDQASLDIKWDLTDSLAVSFLTAYTDVTTKTYIDYDNSQWGLVEDTSNGRINLKSEEIQFTGGGDRVEWVAGVFYWDTYSRTRRSVTRWRISTSTPSE